MLTEVWTASDLDNVRNNLSGKYIQMDDIDLYGWDWTPIGDYYGAGSFTGCYNGNNFTISNLTISPGNDERGLFGSIYVGIDDEDLAVFENINIENANIQLQGEDYIGILAGYCYGNVTVDNCCVEGKIENLSEDMSQRVGGLMGHYFGRGSGNTVINCQSDIEIINCHRITGGMIGSFGGRSSVVERCETKGTITSNLLQMAFNIGGLLGSGSFTTSGHRNYVIDSKANVNIDYSVGSDLMWALGGLIGHAETITKRCCAIGNVVGNANSEKVGGLLGEGSANAVNSYSRGNVKGQKECGGLIGFTRYGVKNCYSTGHVDSEIDAGGLIGIGTFEHTASSELSSDLINCYYDSETSGQSDTGKGTPKTTAEMTYPYSDPDNVYIDWDFYGEAEEPVWQHDKEGLKYKKENVPWLVGEGTISGPINDGYPHFIKALQLKYRHMKAIRGGTVTPIS